MTVVVAAAVGVPDSTRVVALNDAQDGSPLTEYDSGVSPPVPTGRVVLNAVPTVPVLFVTVGAVGIKSVTAVSLVNARMKRSPLAMRAITVSKASGTFHLVQLVPELSTV